MEYKFFKPFALPQTPTFPENTVSITEFGAVADGKTLCSDAINRAIAQCASQNGGRVIIPKGDWLCGAIELKSNINLHFEKGANVLFSTNPDNYLPVVLTTFEDIRCYNYSPLIHGYGLHNVAITGEGTLDGNGSAWWPWHKNKTGMHDLFNACIEDRPVESRVYGTPEASLRPCFLELAECENVLIEGIHLKNSPYWTVHPIWSKNVTVRNVTIENPRHTPNTDGINVDACNMVLVENCKILGGGDDIIAIKSGRGSDGWNVAKACENVLIRNCKGSNIIGGGIVVGSEMSGGVNNILAENCDFEDIYSCIKVKSKKGRGGYVTNMEYRNITGKNVKYGVFLTMKYPFDDLLAQSNIVKMPELANFHVRNLNCDGVEYPIIIEGIEDCTFKNVTLEDVTLLSAKNIATIELAENVNFKNVTIK